MTHSLQLSSTISGPRPGDTFLAGDLSSVLSHASRLKAASRAGSTGERPLLGRNIALLRPRPPEPEMPLLQRAALDLGARVAHVRLGPASEPVGTKFRGLAQMLGRLYDAIDCSELAPAEVRLIEQYAGVPVYDDLEGPAHPARALADLMTLRDHGCVPGTNTQIAFLGDPLSVRARNFFELARREGLCLRMLDLSGAAGDAVFSVDAVDPDHWVLHAPSGPIGAAQCAQNHRFALQAMLLATMPA
ncbi:ornithine carbamoyltransferase [Variovorax beijingensis]|uniref:Ornithine carbamoyltransferase n=2 Tax=Variovorax TaxID=34072 RepID=A0AAE4BWV9_VARPD|nr:MULTISPECIES: hypothetical protein [Variovorax]MDR6427426.1 ornithine carbamoyltransferase [Variovorax paradoxus]MDR6454588.1 ornithine carbamoyltransferase [Variovorax paradoxus]TWD85667.1 ornithine carbamoyltransferase [Variovorax beijingensis]